MTHKTFINEKRKASLDEFRTELEKQKEKNIFIALRKDIKQSARVYLKIRLKGRIYLKSYSIEKFGIKKAIKMAKDEKMKLLVSLF